MGIIGCGAIAQINHIPYMIDYAERFALVALSDISAPLLRAVGEQHQVKTLYADYHELLARQDIEAVIISHSGSHHDTILAALEAGKHIFVEKPVA